MPSFYFNNSNTDNNQSNNKNTGFQIYKSW